MMNNAPCLNLVSLTILLPITLSGCGQSNQPNPSASPEPNSTSNIQLPGPAAPSTVPPPAGMLNTPFLVPPLVNPPLLDASAAEIDPDEPVIGISSGSQHTAWLLKALSNMQSHVIHDTRGPQPIAVTYCDRSDCVRVFSGEPGESLQLQTAGFINGEMCLRVNGQILPHSSQDIALKDYEFTRTTWGEWSKQHPDTSAYNGLPPASASNSAPTPAP